MKNREMEAMNEEELKTQLTELRKELVKSNAQISTGTIPKSPGLIRNTKKNIARILTAIKRREMQKK